MEFKTLATRAAPVRYAESGAGRPLVFLHGVLGLAGMAPFVDALAARFHVYAPLLPGYGDSEEAPGLRDMLDVTLHCLDVVDALELDEPILLGHCMGGMIAAEMAALAPRQVKNLGLICPAGLWQDAHPIPDLFSLLPYQMPALLFHDVEAGTRMMTAGRSLGDPKFLQTHLVQNARQLGMAGRLLFPIPDRGLAQRLYRVKARTLVVWGEDDRMIPPAYAQAFEAAIAGARLVWVAEAGHMAPIEQTARVVEALRALE
jgi:pimeloyl-ACP methyl ester carboxylesterase